MKRVFNKIFLMFNVIVCFVFAVLLSTNNVVLANRTSYESTYAKYEQVETLAENDLGYGVQHTRYSSLSTAKSGYYTGVTVAAATNAPQNVNVLSVPSTTNVRIVNYTYNTSTGWTKQTLSKLVANFEQNNPGWTVIAGVNGDFFDMNGNNKALPYNTSGPTITDGEVLRAISSKSVGYANDGSDNSFKILDGVSYSSYHTLTVYDSEENVIGTYKVDKINEAPTGDEVAIYFTYRTNVDVDWDGKIEYYEETKVTTPIENSYIVSYPDRFIPTSSTNVFAKGTITRINVAEELVFGRFAIVTNNEEIKTKLATDVTIKVQKDLTGDSANYDQIMGVGSTLIENGIISQDDSDGMKIQRHPRTCIGMKRDGTLMFFTVDGRQLENDMYGMTEYEQATMMSFYGCYQAVNIDGGGSTTMGIRNENGNFVIVNSPSEGEERFTTNAILIVVPEFKMSLSKYSDTSVNLYYEPVGKGLSVSNVKVTINDITKDMTSNEMIFDGLTPETLCELTYSYDITYKGGTTNVTSKKQTFTTGKIPPIINKLSFDLVNENSMVEIKYDITDTNNLISLLMLRNGREVTSLSSGVVGTTYLNVSNVSTFEMLLNLNYSTASVPNYTKEENVKIDWFPSTVDLSSYLESEQNVILEEVEKVNDNLLLVTKEEVIELIDNAKIEIEKLKTKESYLMDARTNAKQELDVLLTSKKYSKKNQEIIDSIYDEAITKINTEESLDAIETILNQTIIDINAVKTKGCKSATSLIGIYLLSMSSLGIYLIFKKRN